MTNINCTANCIHQSDGKCSLDNLGTTMVSLNSICSYYNNPKDIQTVSQALKNITKLS